MSAHAVGRRDFGRRFGDSLVLLVVLLLIWQAGYAFVGDTALAPPLTALGLAVSLLSSADFWPNVSATFRPFALALAIEIVAGIAIGAWLGLNRYAREVIEPLVVGFYSVPKIVFYPVILLSFGIGMASEVVFAVIHGILPIILFTTGAVRTIRPVYLKTARVLRLSLPQTIWRVALPAVLPEVFTGLRIAFAVTLLGVLLCEMFGSKNGLGRLLMNAIGVNNVNQIMALALLLSGFAVFMNVILLAIDRRLHRRT